MSEDAIDNAVNVVTLTAIVLLPL